MKAFFATASLIFALAASVAAAPTPGVTSASDNAGRNTRDVATHLDGADVPAILLTDPEGLRGRDTINEEQPEDHSEGLIFEAREEQERDLGDEKRDVQPIVVMLDPSKFDELHSLRSRSEGSDVHQPVILVLDAASLEDSKESTKGLQGRSDSGSDKPVLMLLDPSQLANMGLGDLHARADDSVPPTLEALLNPKHYPGLEGLPHRADGEPHRPIIVVLDPSHLNDLRTRSNPDPELLQSLLGEETFSAVHARAAQHGVHRPIILLVDPAHLGLPSHGLLPRASGDEVQDFDPSTAAKFKHPPIIMLIPLHGLQSKSRWTHPVSEESTAPTVARASPADGHLHPLP
ncbi:hypothetical protein V8E36_001374 [Tilletia maclaganii]